MSYSLDVRVGDELVVINGQLWSLAYLRKPAVCVLTSRLLLKGTKAYRPIGNTLNRMDRASAEVVDRRLPPMSAP